MKKASKENLNSNQKLIKKFIYKLPKKNILFINDNNNNNVNNDEILENNVPNIQNNFNNDDDYTIIIDNGTSK